MTKLEIINETAEFYSLKNRGVNEHTGQCLYFNPKNDTKCAFGRCIQDDKIHLFNNAALGELLGVPGIFGEGNSFGHKGKYAGQNHDDFLKEEYHGHELDFWSHIQGFHDEVANWNADGLSDIGVRRKEHMIEKWSA